MLSYHQLLTLAVAIAFTKPAAPEIIVFCGSPGAGKSSFYWKHLQPLGYGRVNQDILKTVSADGHSARVVRPHRALSNMLKQRDKCVKAATALIEEGTSVAIGMFIRNHILVLHKLKPPDNTNADVDTRAVWVTLAQKLKVPIRCVLFTAPAKLCEHNDTFRALNVSQEVSVSTFNACKGT
jgi:bifunctional polynucleotide phosphatase/kinase